MAYPGIEKERAFSFQIRNKKKIKKIISQFFNIVYYVLSNIQFVMGFVVVGYI